MRRKGFNKCLLKGVLHRNVYIVNSFGSSSWMIIIFYSSHLVVARDNVNVWENVTTEKAQMKERAGLHLNKTWESVIVQHSQAEKVLPSAGY